MPGNQVEHGVDVGEKGDSWMSPGVTLQLPVMMPELLLSQTLKMAENQQAKM